MQKNMDIGGAPYVPWGTPRDRIPSRYRRKNIWKRLLSGALTAVMLAGLLPAAALAAEKSEGLCPHHREHTETCGYLAPVEEVPCGHIHEAGCYSGGVLPAEGEEAAANACTHTHDETCGYAPATAGTPCGFDCPICPVQALIDALPTADALASMWRDERQAVYEDLQTAYEAYNALTDEQKAEVTGAEIFERLFAVFDSMMNTLSDHQHPVCGGDGNCTDPDHTDGHGNVEWTAWENTNAMPIDAGSYYLAGDVSISTTWEVPDGNTNLCLNGHSITFTNGLENWDMSGMDPDDVSRSVIKVSSDSTLTITDCQDNTGAISGGTGTFMSKLEHYNSGSKGYCGGGLFVEGTLELYGGSIKGNHCPMYHDASDDHGGGGGVFLNGGAFDMFGGVITENSAKESGNGVFCNGGRFNMYGGSITENGREIDGWRLTYMGSTGGVGLSNEAEMTMSGGEISSNLTSFTGGVQVDDGSSLTLSGDAKIIDHDCSGIDYGGVFLRGGNAKLIMNGGEISGNAESAVIVNDSETMEMTGGVIEAGDSGAYGIYLDQGSNGDELSVSISGGRVSGNEDVGAAGIGFGEGAGGTLKLSGNPEIQSISLRTDNVITIGGALSYTAPITVIKNGGGTITSGWKTNMTEKEPTDYFTSWSEDYQLELSDGELSLISAETGHSHNDISFDLDLGVDATGYYMGLPGITASGNYRLTSNLAFGDGDNIGNTLFISGKTEQDEIEVNLCLNKYNLSRLQSGYSGPVLAINEGGTLNLYSCANGAITGNSSENDGFFTVGVGGGILVLEGGSLNLYGGHITGNAADDAGGGVYVSVNSTVNLCGGETPIVIADNTVKGAANNLYLEDGATVTVSALPAEGSQIGITMANPGVFATVGDGVTPEDAARFFTSDDTDYRILTTENGLKLAEKYATPDISIDYEDETLTGFEAGGSYTINGTQVVLNQDSTLPIEEEWLGTTISIVRTGDMEPSDTQSLAIPNRPNAPSAPGIDYENEALTGAAENMQYSTDGESWSDCPDDMGLGSFGWTGQQTELYFRAKATKSTFASEYVKVTVPARPSAPAVQGVNETVKGRKDGRITGLTAGAAYEISSDDGKSWSDAALTGTEITGLTPGTYQVRAKASNSSFKSAAATVQIAVGDDPTYTLNVTAPAFDAVYTGYAQPEAKAITISSSGNSDAAISSVSLGGENKEAFVLNKTDGVTIAAGSTDAATYTVRPAAGLSQGTYTAIITVAYHDNMTAEAQVTFTVNRRSSGGGSDPTFPPTIKPGEGGDVTVKPRNPEKGDKVTITPKPEDGYEVDEVIVTDRDGDHVEVTDNGDGTYSFKQPSGKVTIEVTFREIGPEPLPFTDVPPDAWYIDGVRYVYTRHIMNGTSSTTFSPDTSVSRSMIVQILYNLAGQPEVEGGHNFSDVPTGYWSEKAIIWAVQTGVVSGYGNGTFGPEDSLSREQLAVVLFNYANAMGYDATARLDLSGFADVTQAQSWSRTALEWAYAEHLITGTSSTTMSPTGRASRAQIAVIMMRFCERYVESQ